jgi:hypothetical protein
MYMNAKIHAQSTVPRHQNTRSAKVIRNARRVRLEGPKGRRAAQPIYRLGLPVKRFLIENSHGDVLS